MTDDTRDRVIEASTEIRQIKDMLREHIVETRDHRDGLKQEVEAIKDGLKVEMDGIKSTLQTHNNLIQQIKGAKIAISTVVAATTTIGVGIIAKIVGIIRWPN